MTEVVRHLDVLPVLGHTVEGHHGAAEDAGEGGHLGPWERKGHPGTGSVTWGGIGLARDFKWAIVQWTNYAITKTSTKMYLAVFSF